MIYEYLCTKNFVMEDDEVAFKEGEIYYFTKQDKETLVTKSGEPPVLHYMDVERDINPYFKFLGVASDND